MTNEANKNYAIWIMDHDNTMELVRPVEFAHFPFNEQFRNYSDLESGLTFLSLNGICSTESGLQLGSISGSNLMHWFTVLSSSKVADDS